MRKHVILSRVATRSCLIGARGLGRNHVSIYSLLLAGILLN